MNFVLMVEGKTEDKALRQFLQKWLNQELTVKVGIKIVRFDGWSDLVKNAATKALWHINDSPEKDKIIAVIALMDLYGPTFYPSGKTSASERSQWAKDHMEKQVNHAKFRQHFAVHETEAWLLSEPSIFPRDQRSPRRQVSSTRANQFQQAPEEATERTVSHAAQAWLPRSHRRQRFIRETNSFSRLCKMPALESPAGRDACACPKCRAMTEMEHSFG